MQGDISIVEKEMGSRKAYGRLIGALFLAGILVYAVGFQRVSSITSAPDFVSTISAQQTVLVFGAFLMLLNTVVDLGKGVLFFPILENHGKRTAGLPGRERRLGPRPRVTLTEANAIAYNVGQATLCFGGIFLSLLLFRTRLIPGLWRVWA